MTVQFKPAETGPVLSYSVSLYCAKKVADFPADKAEVDSFLSKHNAVCQICSLEGGGFASPNYQWAPVSLSNTNAGDILTILGFEVNHEHGIFGAEAADSFLNRTLSALESDLAKSVRPTIVGGPVISFGTDVKYLKSRISALSGLALWADLNQTKVTWG